MSQSQENHTDIALLAAQWVVRAQADTFGDTDMLALTGWLEADVTHARAFEAALVAWDQVDALAKTQTTPAGASIADDVVGDEVVSLPAFRSRTAARKPLWQSPGALAGLAAAVTAAILIPMFALKDAPARVYQTARGQRQTIALADGSNLQLNTDTRVTVRLAGHARTLVLDRGEMALKVTHDASRPLTLTAGDARISDLGTEFNVHLGDDGSVAVTVREGEVLLAENNAPAATLHAGDGAVHQPGVSGATVSHGDPDQAFAWQKAHAIYRDQPLSIVVKDLNRYFDKPIVVDDQAGRLRLSAILTLDSEPLVVRRLQDFLPLQAKTTDSGIYLSFDTRGGSKP